MLETKLSFAFAVKWIPKLAKLMSKQRQSRRDEINQVAGQFGDPLILAKYYIEPDCQNMNPANYDETGPDLVTRDPIFKKLEQFFSGDIIEPDGANQLFILSDAGMGKTSLLMMLKLAHINALWPKGYHCELLKLGQDTLDHIKKMKEPKQTILLLDALDEDPTAWGRIEARLVELLDASKFFRRVVITCRTQFFPTQKRDTYFRDDRVHIGGFGCPTLYVSYFDSGKIRAYLRKRFSKGWLGKILPGTRQKIQRAEHILKNMRTLAMRPMLLNHIQDLLKAELVSDNQYLVYQALVDRWLQREVRKWIQKDDKPDVAQLWRACEEVALYLHRQGGRHLGENDLNRHMRRYGELRHLQGLGVGGRSLLNKNADGAYRFAHYSIQEFLIVRRILADNELRTPFAAPTTELMMTFVSEYVRSKQTPANPHWFKVLGEPHITLDFPLPGGETVRMVWIPPGTFHMGSPPEEPGRFLNEAQYEAELTGGFWLGESPVTQAQWEAVMKTNPSYFRGPHLPVEQVSWEDCRQFIDTLNGEAAEVLYAFPTEAQWEYACRARTQAPYAGDLDEMAWYQKNSDEKTHEVGQKKPNAWGLYDMHGNVWEWCQDWYGDYPRERQVDPPGPENGMLRVVRGGSWNDSPRFCRLSNRSRLSPTRRGNDLGFRLLRISL